MYEFYTEFKLGKYNSCIIGECSYIESDKDGNHIGQIHSIKYNSNHNLPNLTGCSKSEVARTMNNVYFKYCKTYQKLEAARISGQVMSLITNRDGQEHPCIVLSNTLHKHTDSTGKIVSVPTIEELRQQKEQKEYKIFIDSDKNENDNSDQYNLPKEYNNCTEAPDQYYKKSTVKHCIFNWHLILNLMFWVPIFNWLYWYFSYGFLPTSDDCSDNFSICLTIMMSTSLGICIMILTFFASMVYHIVCGSGFDLFSNCLTHDKLKDYLQNLKDDKIKLTYIDELYVSTLQGYALVTNGTNSAMVPVMHTSLLNSCNDSLLFDTKNDSSNGNSKLYGFRPFTIKTKFHIYYDDETQENIQQFINKCKRKCNHQPIINFESTNYKYNYNPVMIYAGPYWIIWNGFFYFLSILLHLNWLYKLTYVLISKEVTWNIVKIIETPRTIKIMDNCKLYNTF